MTHQIECDGADVNTGDWNGLAVEFHIDHHVGIFFQTFSCFRISFELNVE